MSSLVDGYNRSLTADYRLRVLNQDFESQFPLLAMAFCGVLSDDGKSLVLPPCKVSIWADGGELQCGLLPAVGNRKAFLTLGRGTDHPWGTLEAYLGNGVRWITTGVQKSK